MTVVVVPTYNEKENAGAMASAILSHISSNDRILFVDDNSPDGTGAILDALASSENRICVLHREKKEGLGRAYVAAFARALEMGADRIVQMDCDFSHDPAAIPVLLASGADVAIGSRYVKGGRTEGWPFSRMLISRLGALVVRVVTGMPVKDPTGGFKAFTRRALETIHIEDVASMGYSFQLDMNHRAWKRGLSIRELPITFTERRAGTSKISGEIAVESLKMVFRLRFGGGGK